MINEEIYAKANKINDEKFKKNEEWHKNRDYEGACYDAGICPDCGAKFLMYEKWKWKGLLPAVYYIHECTQCSRYYESKRDLFTNTGIGG